jgi:hypothetical protein
MSYGKTRPPIVFNPGLNTVLGSESGSDSIGKSTFLMIIDFVFGGGDYITKSTDVQKHIGRHTIQFAFKFGNKVYRFSRDTHNPSYVSRCDDGYYALEDIPIKDYYSFLLEQYKISLPDLSFREMVSGYLRIAQRDNHNESHPLKSFLDDSDARLCSHEIDKSVEICYTIKKTEVFFDGRAFGGVSSA